MTSDLRCEFGLELARQQTVLVTFAQDVLKHGLEVRSLVASMGEVAGVEGLGVDDLKEEVAGEFFSRQILGDAPDGGEGPPLMAPMISLRRPRP